MSATSPEPNHATAESLRHMTSQSPVSGRESSRVSANRLSQHLQTGTLKPGGSKSPSSIPSSPTSVHSSSSAIFERDIEPLPMTSHSPPNPAHPPNPHRIARAKGTEQLELSVPSVLDSAASILATVEDVQEVSVVTPAVDGTRSRTISSGWASPIGSLRSRSPSPFGSRASATASSPGRASLLLNIPAAGSTSPRHQPMLSPPVSSPSAASATSPGSPGSAMPTHAPVTARQTTAAQPLAALSADGSSHSAQGAAPETPSLVTPTSAYFSTASSTGSSPTTTTTRDHPLHSLPPPSPPASNPTARSPQLNLSISHPPSPKASTKRLSFMSYSDLLSSTPASAHTLSSLTHCSEPPPHIPTVSGFTAAQNHGASHGNNRDSIFMLDDVGGEWEREGLGRGLEERLESLLPLQGRA